MVIASSQKREQWIVIGVVLLVLKSVKAMFIVGTKETAILEEKMIWVELTDSTDTDLFMITDFANHIGVKIGSRIGTKLGAISFASIPVSTCAHIRYTG